MLMATLSRVNLSLTLVSQLDMRFANAVKGERLENLFYSELKTLQLVVFQSHTSVSRDVSIDVAAKIVRKSS